MPRKLPPFVERWRDRHGKMRHYFRKAKGARIPLPGPETAEFEAAYQAALRGHSVAKPTRQVDTHGCPVPAGTSACDASGQRTQLVLATAGLMRQSRMLIQDIE